MLHKTAALLEDIRVAAEELEGYFQNSSLDEYLSDGRTRRAVERCLLIVGEALAQIRKINEPFLGKIPQAHRIIGVRNILVHEYSKVDSGLIWHAVVEDLPGLRETVKKLLEEWDG